MSVRFRHHLIVFRLEELIKGYEISQARTAAWTGESSPIRVSVYMIMESPCMCLSASMYDVWLSPWLSLYVCLCLCVCPLCLLVK